MNNSLFRIIDDFSKNSPIKIIAIATLLTTVVSMILVVVVLYLFTGEVDPVIFSLSIIMPVILTPVVLAIVFRLVTRLEHYKSALEKEIEKNHEKDLILFEQERFALMGEMLSSISHQWRQPLNAINLTLLSTKLSNTSGQFDEQLNKAFDIIEKNTHYLSNTIEDFRSFFQNRAPKKVLSLKEIIYELNNVITPLLHADDITLKINWNDDVIDRLYLATAISQVLLNLINNSRDALENQDVDKKYIRIAFEKSPEHLIISVADNGSGINPEVKTKIFDPYFTTKESLKGSGIGLHMSRQIIEKIFGGSIALTYASAGETCFKIELPYSEYCRLQS